MWNALINPGTIGMTLLTACLGLTNYR
jgi:hypothetical protein